MVRYRLVGGMLIAFVFVAVCVPALADEPWQRVLSPEEQTIVALLRGPAAKADYLEYDVHITVPGPGQRRPLTIEAHCRLEAGVGDITILRSSRPLGPLAFAFVVQGGLTYQVTKRDAEATLRDRPVARFTRGGEPFLGDPFWRAPALGPMLLSAADALDLAAFAWKRADGGDHGLQVYEARALRPIRAAESPQPVGYRFWFDPTQRCVSRVVAFGAEDAVIAETTYSDSVKTAEGRAVPLSASTTVGAGSWIYRIRVDDEMRDVPVPRPAMTIVTRYKWLAEEGVRVPLRREVTDEAGNLLCLTAFSNHHLFPVPPE